jgi:hypothetical protein
VPVAEVSQSPLALPLETCHTNSMIKGNEMQVWMVMGGWEYEGDHGDSMRLFDCKSTAQAYRDELKEEGYDYIDCKVMGVCMESALAR